MATEDPPQIELFRLTGPQLDAVATLLRLDTSFLPGPEAAPASRAAGVLDLLRAEKRGADLGPALETLKQRSANTATTHTTTTEQSPLASRLPSSTGAAMGGQPEVIRLEPSGNDNWVRFVEDKYKANSAFSVTAQCHVLIGPEAVTLLALSGRYYARGCGSLHNEPFLRINGDPVEFADQTTLKRPHRFDHEATAVLEYHRSCRPPLMVMCANDCDFGDLEIRIRCRVGRSLQDEFFVFEFCPGGRLQPVRRVRDVPQVNDARLAELHQQGCLTDDQYTALVSYPAEDRYFAAMSDKKSCHCLGLAEPHRDLLRAIVRGGLPR
jgi:hypothetical protein